MANESVSVKMDGPQKAYRGKKLRIAIIGCGGIAQTHLGAYRKNPAVEVVAGVDIRADRLAVMRDKWGVKPEALFGADLASGKELSKTAWRDMLAAMGGCEFPSGKIFTDQDHTMVNITPAYLDPAGDEWDNLFATKLGNWVDGCLKGMPLGATGDDGLNVQRILNGLYDSAAAGGREVAIH